MENYLRRIPLLLSLAVGTILGMFFLYNKSTLSDIPLIMIGAVVIFYIIGKNLCENLREIIENYNEQKKYERNFNIKEGTHENMENINVESSSEKGSNFNARVDENSDSNFVELGNFVSREQK